mgnify:CR=1 FL=1
MVCYKATIRFSESVTSASNMQDRYYNGVHNKKMPRYDYRDSLKRVCSTQCLVDT